MALNPQHDVPIGAHHRAAGHGEEEFVRDFVLHPQDEILLIVAASSSLRTLSTLKTRPSRL